MVDETGELRSHAHTEDRGGGNGNAAQNDYIAMQARSDRAYRALSVPRFTSTLLIKLRGLQINLSLITRPVPIRTGEKPPP